MPVKISVVIPTYRRPVLLSHCLGALARQTLDPADYEVIVVSDGPDLVAEQTVRQLAAPPGLRFLHLPEKKGPAAARNLGWRNASGRLIAFTDDDCLPDANWLRALWEAYTAGEKAGAEKAAFTGRI